MSIRHRLKLLVGNQRNQSLCALGVVVVALGVFLFANPAAAFSIPETVRDIIGSILEFFIWAIGSLLFMVMKALISIAQYNHFVDSHTVELGWAIVRDLTNMFFVLLMLIVAFSTILGVPKDYVWTAVLPRLLVMAVLINFSKVIVGLLVDFSQVVMMTFVNGFSAAAGANMVNMLGIRNTVGFSPAASPIGAWDTVAAQFLAVVMLGLSLAAVVMFMLMLVSRIVMIWILTILSPLAFFLSAVPSSRAKAQYSEWWKMLGEYLVAGPVLAFFLWLSFAVAGSGNLAEQEGFEALPAGSAAVSREGGIRSLAGQEGNFISYVVGLALLMGGMTITSRFSVIGGSGLSGAVNWVKNKGTSFAKSAAKAPFRAAGAATGFVAKDLETRLYARTGVGLDPRRYVAGFQKGYKERVADREKKGEGQVEKARLAGGWRGKYAAPLFGKPDQFVREHGVLGIPALAGKGVVGLGKIAGAGIFRKHWGDKVAPRSTEAYTKQYNETQAKLQQVSSQREKYKDLAEMPGRMQLNYQKQTADRERLEAAQNKRKGLETALENQERQRVPESFKEATRKDLEAAAKEEAAAREDLTTSETTGQNLQSSYVDLKRDLGDITPEMAREKLSASEKEEAKLKNREQTLAQKVAASRPTGAAGELPKHKVQKEDLKFALDLAVDAKDAVGIQTVMRKAAADNMVGDLLQQYQRPGKKDENGNPVSYSGDLAGFRAFAGEVLQNKGKMGEPETLALADEVGSYQKGESVAFANMTKATVGGQRRWATEEERALATGSDLYRGDANEKLKKGSGDIIGTKNEQGEFVMPPAAQAFIAQIAEKLDKRLDGSAKSGAPLVSKSIREKIASNGDAILDTMRRLLQQGVIDQQKFGAIESAVRKAKTKVAQQEGGGQQGMDALIKKVLKAQVT